MRVLQGVTGQAGQPSALAAGLREIGIEAEACTIAAHAFKYPADIFVDVAKTRSLSEMRDKLTPLIARFDVFHFHARPFLASWPDWAYPAALDLLLLKLEGKKVFFHFRGQEIRLASEFAAKNPFHYVNEPSGHLFQRMPDAAKLKLRDFVTAVCDGVFVTDPELQTYVPGSIVVPRALDAKKWEYVGVSDRTAPIIVHAPSRRGVKGTQALLSALDALKAEGVQFELRLVENLSHADAAEVYRQADIIVDQLRIGWYGVLTCEAMALGKPVIAYIRDDLWQVHQDTLPLVNANPLTIKAQLKALIEAPAERQRLAQEARAYFLRHHAATEVARLLSGYYAKDARPVDLAGVARFLDAQNMPGAGQALSNVVTKTRSSAWLLWKIFRADGAGAALDHISRFVRNRVRT